MIIIIKVKYKNKSYKLETIENAIDHNDYWLTNEEDEGMTLSDKNLFDIFLHASGVNSDT